jgi:nitrite reductase (NO-forming)
MVGTITVMEGGGGEAPASPPADSSGGTPADQAEGDGAAAAGAPTEVELAMVDIAFEPAELTIAANTEVTINLPNHGALPHAFEIPEQGIASDEIAGGETTSVVVNLPPGEYQFICPVPGHADAGMVGTLIVTGEAPAGEGTAEASPAASPEASPAASPAAALPTEVELVMIDIAFEPTELTIPANFDVTINLPNQGALPHAFEIPDQGIASEEVAGGASTSVVVNLPPGEYRFICPVPGHESAGMLGTLVVVDEGAAPAEDEPGGETTASDAPTNVDLDMVDIAFEPVDFTIAANTDVTINLTNSGALPHAFQLEDGSVASEELTGGGSTTVTLNLPPGTYRYICPVPGHADAGMVGTITVE